MYIFLQYFKRLNFFLIAILYVVSWLRLDSLFQDESSLVCCGWVCEVEMGKTVTPTAKSSWKKLRTSFFGVATVIVSYLCLLLRQISGEWMCSEWPCIVINTSEKLSSNTSHFFSSALFIRHKVFTHCYLA